MSGAEIFKYFCALNLDYKSFDWLENRGLSEFEILISVILTQNTKWDNVVRALANIKSAKITSLESLARLESNVLATLIKPSGFYNTKAKRLKVLCEAILKDFESFENFKENVSRKWLLSVKGLGFESADSILNYVCGREILVVDSYSQRLAAALGYEFEDYEELREFFQSGVEGEAEQICELLGKECALYELYQIFHAQIIAFCKAYFKGKVLNLDGEQILKKLKSEG